MAMTTTPNSYTYFYYFYNDPDGGEVYTENMPGDVDWKPPRYGIVHDDYTKEAPAMADGFGGTGGVGEGGGGRGEGGMMGGIAGEDGDKYHESVHERGFVNSANIGIAITVCNIALNVLLLALVMLRRSTRLQFVYQQVMNLAFSDLAFSVVVDPFTIYYELQPWRLGPGFCVAWMVLDSALPFVSFLILITLNADRFFFAVSPGLYHRASRRVPLRMLCFLLPWTAGLGVVVPLWMLTAVAWPQHGICMYGVTKKAAMASSVLSLYLPCVALIVLTVLVLVTIIGGMPEDPYHERVRTTAVATRRPLPPLAPSCARSPRLAAVIKQEGGGGGGNVGYIVSSGETTLTNLPQTQSLSPPSAPPAPSQLSNGPHTHNNSSSNNNLSNLTSGHQAPLETTTTTMMMTTTTTPSAAAALNTTTSEGTGGGFARTTATAGSWRREDAGGGRCSGGGDGSDARPVMNKSHRSLVVALCVLNLLTVITQLPYGAITMLEPECVEQSCQSTIKLIQALSWMRSVTFSLHPFCLVAMTAIRDTCCYLFGRGTSGFDPRCTIRDDPTASGNTNSEHMELASVNAAGVHAPHKGPSTMV